MAAAGLLLSGVARAGVEDSSGDVRLRVSLPASLDDNDYESDSVIRLMPEGLSRRLGAELEVDLLMPGVLATGSSSSGVLPEGITVSTYVFHADPLHSDLLALSGSATFGEPILGVIFSSSLLHASDTVIGAPGFSYSGSEYRGIEPGIGDRVTVEGTRIDLNLILTSYMDEVRVITGSPFLFSLDLGSDSALSDPDGDGSESFDCGDMYRSAAGSGMELFWNDTDHAWPLGGARPNSIDPAPYAVGPRRILDIDGFERCLYVIDGTLSAPLYFNSQEDARASGLMPLERLLLSFNDDDEASWFGTAPYSALPVHSLPDHGGEYGLRNELVEIVVGDLDGPSTIAVLDQIPVARETDVHPDLAPNPYDEFSQFDDDVDALAAGVLAGPGGASYFSVDHEGSAGLDPASIYKAVPGGMPIESIPRELMGLPWGTDIDAFTFAGLTLGYDGPGGWTALNVLFSVNRDNPETSRDESGGLDPRFVYVSALSGSNMLLIDDFSPEFLDDIDALTIALPGPRSSSLGVAYCEGDGSESACPCGNESDGSQGTSGCANGIFASGATLRASGSNSVLADDAVLLANFVEPDQLGLFFQASHAPAGGDGLVYGDGMRCTVGPAMRLYVFMADAAGGAASDGSAGSCVAALGLGFNCGRPLDDVGAVHPGETDYYQYWYRNPTDSPCGFGFNFTNALAISWGL